MSQVTGTFEVIVRKKTPSIYCIWGPKIRLL